MGAHCFKNLPPITDTEEHFPKANMVIQEKNQNPENEVQECISSQFFEQALYWIDQAYPDWKETLTSEFNQVETICIPDSLDIGSKKFFGPIQPADGYDKNAVKKAKVNIQGDIGEETFFSKFRNLKLGGILINGFFSQDFISVMSNCGVSDFSKDMNKEWKEKKRHFECDFIFIHEHFGIIIVEVKSCENETEVIKNCRTAGKQLERSIVELKSLYEILTKNEFDCPGNVQGVICLPCFDATTSRKPQKLTELEGEVSFRIIEKSKMDSIESFKQIWDEIPKQPFTLTSNLTKFITAIFSYQPATYMSATCNALEIYRRIYTQDFEISGFKQIDTIFFNDNQLNAIRNSNKRVLISGPPGTGKTLCLIQRALEMATIKKRGRIVLATPLAQELAPKIKKITASCARFCRHVLERVPLVTNSLSFNYEPDDDLLVDEIALEYKQDTLLSFQKQLTVRELRDGSTTVAITGWMTPAQVTEKAEKYDIFTNFKLIELKTVIRGTKNIINEWNIENHFPKDYKLRIGHNITGTAIGRYTVTNATKMLAILRKEIQTLLNPPPKTVPTEVKLTKNGGNQQQFVNGDECSKSLGVKDQSKLSMHPKEELKKRKQPQKCTEQVENSSLIAVDNATNAPSYEWPIVIVIAVTDGTESFKTDSEYLIATSRAIAKLIVINFIQEDSVHE